MSSAVSTTAVPEARSILTGAAEGPVIATTEALSFWGGVDPATGRVIDVHHPLHGACLTGGVLFMPTSRGSCTGSGVLLDLILTGRAPSALVFCEAEDVLTLGALVAAEMFDRALPVIRLDAENFTRFSRAAHVRIDGNSIEADGLSLAIAPPAIAHLDLEDGDRGDA
jgi:predicted aconitase with swiveling domain